MPEEKKTTVRITMVKTINPIQFFGVAGSQLAVSQGGGLIFSKVPEGIQVSSLHWPNKQYTIYAANIAHVERTQEEA